MAIQSLTLDTLKDLDSGIAAQAFTKAMRRAIEDCTERPQEAKARKVILQAELVPAAGEGGFCDEIDVTIQVKDTFPNRTTKTVRCSIRKQGSQLMLVFQDDASEEAA